jgi:hypothetical protein
MRFRECCFGMLFMVMPVSFAKGGAGSRLCDSIHLPSALRNRLESDFASWKTQAVTDLSTYAKQRWRSEKPLACPGIVAGRLQTAEHDTYVLLLVSRNGSDNAYRLVAFVPSDNAGSYVPQLIEQWDKGGSSHYFVHTIQLDKVFSPTWVRKLHVKVSQGVLFVDAAESEYGAEVYFWADGKYRHESIDY